MLETIQKLSEKITGDYDYLTTTAPEEKLLADEKLLTIPKEKSLEEVAKELGISGHSLMSLSF